MSNRYEGNRYQDVLQKIQPQAKELEEVVLGAMLLEKDAYYKVSALLKAEVFYVTANQHVYNAIQLLADAHKPVDILTVVEQLRSMGRIEEIGGAYYVTKLTNSVVSSAHIKGHARIILDKYMQRELIRLCGQIMNIAYEDACDVSQTIDELSKSLIALQSNVSGKALIKLDEAITQTIQESSVKKQVGNEGILMPVETIRYIIPSLQPTDLMILAARPSVGKTAFSLEIGRHAAAQGKKVVIFSMEMSTNQLIKRMLSAATRTPYAAVNNWNMSDQQLQKLMDGIEPLLKYNLYIDDTFNHTTRTIYSKAIGHKLKHGLDLIIIDYLQLIKPLGAKRNSSKNDDMTDISRECKGIAKDLGVSVIALSQLSREVEKQGREPRLSDLRDSGAIEQDADVVAFLFRQGDEDENNPTKQIGFKVDKHRNGALGKVPIWFEGNYQAFTDKEPLNSYYEPQKDEPF
jgi:replicative DNA helicase